MAKPKPKDWPDSLPYLDRPLHDRALPPAHLQRLRTKPPPSSSSSVPSIPAPATPSPYPHVRIRAIRDAAHPAHGQRGLFAARALAPGSFILAYLGRVHAGSASSAESDYDLWLDREADVAVDAAAAGNEGRFVNDYRGVGARPNAVFGTAWCERWRELCVGVWVAGGRDGRGVGIRKGEEILVSYGKGFWGGRRCGSGGEGEDEGEAGGGASGQ
ncbi:uncharacterized protein UV8b_05450 [Ustilaginoidea virens]|uniref:SET domain-containing protein n=1 Tax=Ustilaginoidea virens TaxID=1159556 RepID=A0A8E5HTG6_USTVR|nr:uncharacterized protein UV8b_05450 [Ustilaginoidea virens]QUC21207.1 hypothetical protein UV8b_05450 [Ustilaginoidea virens]